MKLVNDEDIAKITKLDKLGMPYLAQLIMRITQLSRVNSFYDHHFSKNGLDFVDAIFKEIELEYDYFEEELLRIPAEGPFVTVSNHPLGGIDGLILLKLISKRRPDYKVMANFLLQKIEPLKDHFMPVNPFENRKDLRSSYQGIKESMAYIRDGHGLGMFPAGEVSTLHLESGKILDKEWQIPAIRLLRKMEAPIIPIFFRARNSRLFYMLSLLSPTLQTAKLPSELFGHNTRSIRVRIGKPIPFHEYKDLSEEETRDILREHTYRLANTLDGEPRLNIIRNRFTLRPSKPEHPVADEQPAEKIREEIATAKEQEHLLTEFRNFQVYCCPASKIPHILLEIGRLREITFREVGEGTGNERDLDKFDKHYLHLILWDKVAGKIAGAYRLGMGHDLYEKKGLKAFYIKTLFRIDREVHPVFQKSLEMGRAFITSEYQQKPMPLFLLWKGITHVVLRNRDKVRYLTGCVSISNRFSKYSKSIMIEFVKRHFYDAEMAKHIHPRKEYKVKLGPLERAMLDKTTPDDINKFDRYIDDIEPGNMRFPVLLKKYIKQNAKIVAFNVDPKFNHAVDGFMYIDINNLPEQTIKPVMEELEEATKKHARETR